MTTDHDDHDDELVDALRRALDKDRHPLAAVISRGFTQTEATTSSATTSTTSLTHQDHALAERLGADIHTPNHQ